jgi:hypothetical protein
LLQGQRPPPGFGDAQADNRNRLPTGFHVVGLGDSEAGMYEHAQHLQREAIGS